MEFTVHGSDGSLYQFSGVKVHDIDGLGIDA